MGNLEQIDRVKVILDIPAKVEGFIGRQTEMF
jgi:hypothetical protein